jgi:hypothetical protein
MGNLDLLAIPEVKFSGWEPPFARFRNLKLERTREFKRTTKQIYQPKSATENILITKLAFIIIRC